MENRSQELNFAIELALDGGQILLDGYNADYRIEKKEDGSIVTSVDHSVSRLICERVRTFYPDFALLDEENGDTTERFQRDFCWVTDPLDSTRDYVDRKDGYSIIIGLMHQGIPILGVNYRPQIDELTYAVRGEGAYLIKAGIKDRIQVSQDEEINVLHTRSRYGENLERMIDKLNPVSKIAMGGFAKVIEVAKGSGNLFLSPLGNNFHLWDICGTSIILEEAGGKITDINGQEINFSQLDVKYSCGIIAASKKIHGKVLNRLNE
tara:strand:- start:225 stop:1019 length:795 start_codon:yes stop_codon:yes gene_type:complete